MSDALEFATVSVCHTDITIAGAPGDAYFRQCAERRDLFEPAVAVAALLLPVDGVVIDGGASLGMVSAAIARRFPGAAIIAFEASPAAIPSTRATFDATGVDPVLVPKALGAEAGSLSFYVDGNGTGWGFLNDEIGEHAVDVVALDDALADHGTDRVDLLKLDVEGGELAALRGAVRTIERHRPTLVMELNPFTLWRWGRTFPQDLLAWVEDRYDHLLAIDPQGGVEPLPTHEAVMELLYRLGVHGGVVDIVATAAPFAPTTDDLVPYLPREVRAEPMPSLPRAGVGRRLAHAARAFRAGPG